MTPSVVDELGSREVAALRAGVPDGGLPSSYGSGVRLIFVALDGEVVFGAREHAPTIRLPSREVEAS